MFSILGTRTYCMTLPSHQMLQMQRIQHIVMDCSHIKYHLQAHQHNITRCTEITTPGQALDTAKKIETGGTGPDPSLGVADITAPDIVTCTEATPDHNKGTDTATIVAAQGDPIKHTKATATESTMTCLTWPHCISPTHDSSSGYCSQDQSRSGSPPSYRSSRYNPHHRDSCSSRYYSNQGAQRSHHSKNRKVHIEEPPLDFYSLDDNSTNSGEESESLN